MEMEKRKRCTNFTQGEASILVFIVKKYKTIIENKKTDAVTNREKVRTWEKISTDFNTICGTGRTASVLKTKYNNFKRITKKNVSDEIGQVRGTGGGPPIAEVLWNKPEIEIEGMMRRSTLSGFPSQFDGDSLNVSEKNELRLMPQDVDIQFYEEELAALQRKNEMERHKQQLLYMKLEHEDNMKKIEQEWQLKKALMIQAQKAELNFKKSLMKSMKE